MASLRDGHTLRKTSTKYAAFNAYCGSHPVYAREALPLMAENLKAAHHRKGERFRTMTHCMLGLHPMTGDNVKIHGTTGRRYCAACRKVSSERAPAMKAEQIEAVKQALQNGVTIGQICFGKPVGGGQVDRKLCLITPRVLYHHRRENPDFDKFVAEAVVGNNYTGQQIRRSRVRTRAHTEAARQETNDYHRIRAMLPTNFPDKDDVVSNIFEALLNGSLKREDVRARVKRYIADHNRMFPTKYATFAGRPLVSLDARLFDDGR
jgi:hypothetical protein